MRETRRWAGLAAAWVLVISVGMGCSKKDDDATTTTAAAATPSSNMAGNSKSSSNQALGAGSMTSATGLAPAAVLGRVARAPGAQGLTGPDGDGFYAYSGFTGSTVKIKFLNASNNAVAPGPTIVKLNVVVSSQYSYGTFTGNFVVRVSDDSLESGTITSADPVNGTFTATISGMTFEMTTINNQTIGIPITGTMTLTSTSGYGGTNTFSKSGSDYKCEGPITVSGNEVARVYLTFNTSFGNYTGYYTTTGSDTHNAIQ
jgi:hypothetical protein